MLKIKVCGLTNLPNILEVAALGIDLAGFIFYPPSPRYVVGKLDPAEAKAIPESILKMGIFVDADIEDVLQYADRYSLDGVQLHGNESVEYCAQLKEAGLDVIKTLAMGDGVDFRFLESYFLHCSYLLFDTSVPEKGGSGKQFDWSLIDAYPYSHPFFLSGGIGPGDEDRINAIKHPALAGIDLNSRFEREPGIKDVARLHTFITMARRGLLHTPQSPKP